MIDYYLSLQSPFSYLGSERLQDIAARHGADIVYKPVRLPRLFEATGGVPLAKRSSQRRAYRLVELRRWSDALDLPLILEPAFFPVDETLAARMVIAAQEQGIDVGPLTTAILRGVWALECNIADRCTLAQLAAGVGLDGDGLLDLANDQGSVEILDNNTEEAISRGVFGVPSYVFDYEIFWGQDRLDFLEQALADGEND